MAAATRRWTPPGPGGSGGGHDHRLSPDPGADAGARGGGDRRRGRGHRINWLRTITSMGERLTVEIQELDETAGPSRPASSRLSRRTPSSSPSVRRATPSSQDDAGHRGSTGTSSGRPVTLMTGAPGVFAGGDAVPSERTVTVGVGHGKKAARNIDAWLRGTVYDKGPKHPEATLTSSTSGTSATTPAGSTGPRPADPGRRLRRGRLRAVRRRAQFRRPLPVLRQLLRVRRLLGACPRTPSSARRRPPISLRLRQVHRLRHASASARSTRSR